MALHVSAPFCSPSFSACVRHALRTDAFASYSVLLQLATVKGDLRAMLSISTEEVLRRLLDVAGYLESLERTTPLSTEASIVMWWWEKGGGGEKGRFGRLDYGNAIF